MGRPWSVVLHACTQTAAVYATELRRVAIGETGNGFAPLFHRHRPGGAGGRTTT
jgi:hypothetical protein